MPMYHIMLPTSVDTAPISAFKNIIALAFLFVSGKVLSFSSKAFHSLSGYRNKQPSIPFVITKCSPRLSRNLEGIISLPFESIL